MKRILLTIALIGVLAAPASAQLISLWADADMTSCSVTPGMGGTFDLYICVEPDTRGVFGAEFSITNPSPAIFFTPPGEVTWNSAAQVTVSMGSFFGSGISLGFNQCINVPMWIASYNFTNYEMNPVFFTLGVATTGDPPVVQDHINVAICDEAHTKVEGFAYNHFGINQGCEIGTEETSWGAIKSMME
jgi:hypothetical protein